MSFGSSIGDLVLLTQLAWKTVQNCRRACGEYAALTLEATSLHKLLQRLESELQSPDCLINRDTDDVQKELGNIIQGCEKNLELLDLVLEKYNALSETERSGRKLWQRIRFGNGQIADMTDVRGRNTFYISAISLFLNMLNFGSAGRVEREMTRAGGELRDIRLAVNGITAYLMTGGGPEGSALTAYANDEKAVWKQFRRELVADGFTSSTIRKHKPVIMAYVRELGSRGLLEEGDQHASGERDGEVRRAISNRETVQPEADKRSPNEQSASSLRDTTLVEDANPEANSTDIQSPASDLATSHHPLLEPTPSLKRGPAPKDSSPSNTEQVPPASNSTSPTALAKLRSIEHKLHTDFIPRAEAIIQRPPADRNAHLSANPKDLVEEILQHGIFELDAIDIEEGDAELRALRKDLVWQAQVWLIEVDTVVSEEPASSSSSSADDSLVPQYNFQTDESEDIWPPGIVIGQQQQSANDDGPRLVVLAASGTRTDTPIMFDGEGGRRHNNGFEEDEIERGGVSGKYAAWLSFAENYIREDRQRGVCYSGHKKIEMVGKKGGKKNEKERG